MLQQRRQATAQRREKLLQPLKCEIGFERLSEGFPAASWFRQLTGLFLPQPDHPSKRWRKKRKIGSAAGLLPEVIALGFGRGESTDKIRIKCLLSP